MKCIAFLLLLICLPALCVGQTSRRSMTRARCTMSLAQLPEIRGLRLGMSVADLTAAFPEETDKKAIQRAVDDAKKPDAYGFARATLHRSYPEVNPKFSGVLFILVQLVDERVSLFRIDYERG